MRNDILVQATSNEPDPTADTISPHALTLVELSQEQVDSIVQTVPGGARNVLDIYPLSPLQEGILFHHRLNDKGDTYVLSTLFEAQSRAHIDALIHALQEVINYHEVLRTGVIWDGLPQPVQVVYRRAPLPIEEQVLDASRDSLQQLMEWMRPGRRQLDVRHAPLVQLHIAADPHSHKWYAVLFVHHLVCDHQSLRRLVAEVFGHLKGHDQPRPSAAAFRSYVAHVLARTKADDAETFFRSKLADFSEPTAPFGQSDVHGDGSHIEEARLALAPELAQKIRAQAAQQGVSAARLFHAAWALVVACTSGQSDVVFGTVLRGQKLRDASAQRILGMLVNTLPLRLRLQNVSIKSLVEQTNHELAQLLNYKETSLVLAQRCSGIDGSAPLFSSLLNYRHSAPEAVLDQSDAAGVRVLVRAEAWSNYPVSVIVDDLGEGFELVAQADRRIGPTRMLQYLQTAIDSVAAALNQAPQTPALRLQVLPAAEQRQVIELFNATEVPYVRDRLIHELFEEQVRRTPAATAIVCDEESLTYAQLNRRANRLARHLRARGVAPDRLVGICIERSLDMVVGLLAILKAGGAYLPLDPSYPVERLQYILRDSAPVALLTRQSHSGVFHQCECQVIALEDVADEINRNSQSNPSALEIGLQSKHLSYVIYTSGSTGTPKGVAIEHRNVINLIEWHCATFALRQGDRCSCLAAVGFDAAAWEIWPALTRGATLVLASPASSVDVDALLNWWVLQPLDISFLPTPMAELMLSRNARNSTLRTLLVGGDSLRSRPASESFEVINNYGPTEATVLATSGRIHEEDSVIHIGRPTSNAQIYILDGNQRAVPVGVVGEIYIGGAGVARGYLNRPEMTAQCFVPDPFCADPHARMYRTGDLGRWRPDGTIEHLGRGDHQVKIRGFRVELGEIEAQLMRHPLVKEAVVIVREDVPGKRRLVAYSVFRHPSSGEHQPSADVLRAHLKAVLPDYMVPGAFVTLERLPLTENGKLARRALPPPDLGAYATSSYEMPRGNVEKVLAGLWQELLCVERVGRKDNFFELGGHSLLAMQLIARIHSSLSLEVPMRLPFEYPTVEKLAAQIDELRRQRLLSRITAGDTEIEELLENIASMSEAEAQALLEELATESEQ